jgi:cell wall assembly regulator SMI1
MNMTGIFLEQLALKNTLKKEAENLIQRVNHAFSLRTGKAAEWKNWSVADQVGPLQISQIERVLGTQLPDDVVACYLACNGIVETAGWHWKPALEAQLNSRLMIALMEMRQGCAGWEYPSEEFNFDRTVRAGWWHKGWIPIAESTSAPYGVLLCIDTVPGPAGQWGQLIEVTNSSWALSQSNQQARRVAAGLMDFFETLALVLEADPIPQEVVYWLQDCRNRRLKADSIVLVNTVRTPMSTLDILQARRHTQEIQPPVALKAEPALLLSDLAKPHLELGLDRKNRIDVKLPCRVQEVRQGSSAFCPYSSNSVGFDLLMQEWLRSWSNSKVGSSVFFSSLWGSSKTDSILYLAEYLAQKHSVDADSRVPLYIDLKKHIAPYVAIDEIPSCLEHLLSAELKLRNLPDAVSTLMQAIRDGRCVVLMDHAEAMATYRNDVWSWLQQLPVYCEDGVSRSAFLLLACRSEWFDTVSEQLIAVNSFEQTLAQTRDKCFYLTFNQIDSSICQNWFSALGIEDLYEQVKANVFQGFGSESQPLPAVAKALKPLLENPTQAAKKNYLILTFFEAYESWWSSIVTDDLDFNQSDLSTLVCLIGMVAQAVRISNGANSDHITAKIFSDIVQDHWPKASTLELRKLRMMVRVGLRLRMDKDSSIMLRENLNIWLAYGLYIDLKNGHVDNTLGAIAQNSDKTRLLEVFSQYCFELGDQELLTMVKAMLCMEQTPQHAGVLFSLGIALARVYSQNPWSQLTVQDLRHSLPVPLLLANLKGADLSNTDFSKLTLEDIDFSGANLNGAKFIDSQLTRVCFNGATADDADFTEAKLCDIQADGLRAHRSCWSHAQWDRRYPNADLDGALSSVPGANPQTQGGDYIFRAIIGSTLDSVRYLVSSPDNHLIAVMSKECALSVWSAVNLDVIWRVSIPESALGGTSSLCFSADGERLFSGHGDGSVYCWSAIDGKQLACKQLIGFDSLRFIGAPKSKSLICISPSHASQISAIEDMPPIKIVSTWHSQIQDSDLVTIALASNEKHVFIGRSNTDASVFVEKLCTDTINRDSVAWASMAVYSMAAQVDALNGHDWLAVLGLDQVVVGDPNAATQRWIFKCQNADFSSIKRNLSYASLSFSPDGRWLACVGENVKARFFDLHAGTEHILQNCDDCVCIAFTPDGRNMILGGSQLTLRALP